MRCIGGRGPRGWCDVAEFGAFCFAETKLSPRSHVATVQLAACVSRFQTSRGACGRKDGQCLQSKLLPGLLSVSTVCRDSRLVLWMIVSAKLVGLSCCMLCTCLGTVALFLACLPHELYYILNSILLFIGGAVCSFVFAP